MESKIKDSVILITGGAGQIGSYILDEVIKLDPKKVIVIDNFFNSDKKYLKKHLAYIQVYPIDISSLEEMDYVFSVEKPDYVFHCASMLIQDSEALPRKGINTNIMGTYNVIDMCNKYKVKKICYSSSASVYGEPKTLPVSENHPYQYKNFIYGWTKITAEMIFLSNCKCDWVGFRYYNVYSERMRKGAFYTQVFPKFYESINNGTPVIIYGDGNQTMDLIHAKDIARANILGLESDKSDEFYNVGSGSETSANDLAKLMMKVLQKEVEIIYLSNDKQKVKNRKSDTDKIWQDLGFAPKITLEYGMNSYLSSKIAEVGMSPFQF